MWIAGLRELMNIVPNIASPAHWRWAQSCLAAMAKRGAAGVLRKSELRSLLRRANASTSLSTKSLGERLDTFAQIEKRLGLPEWVEAAQGSGTRRHELLGVRQVTGLLLQLSTSSHEITELFDIYSTGGRMGWSEWNRYVRTEQLTTCGDAGQADFLRLPDSDEDELDSRHRRAFERAIQRKNTDGQGDEELELLQFSLLLLSPQNGAVMPAREPNVNADMREPLAHYWTACSHKYVGPDRTQDRTSAAPPRFVR
jgi:hypothetical protein